MRIKIKQSELWKGISIAKEAVIKDSIIPEFLNLLFVTEDNRLKLIGNNGDIGIETYLDAEIIEPGKITIDCKRMEKTVRKIIEEDLEVIVDKDCEVIINGKKLNIKTQGLKPRSLTELKTIKEGQTVTVMENELKYMINQTLFAVSKNYDAHPHLTGELIKFGDNEMIIVACDGYRLAFRKCLYKGNLNTNIRIVLPKESLSVLESLLSNNSESQVEITLSDKVILFKIGKTKFLTRMMENKFTDYELFMHMKIIAEMIIEKKEIINALELACVFCKDGNKKVKFSLSENKLKLSANSDEGSISRIIEVNYRGEEILSAFNAVYFLEALRTIDEEYITFRLYNKNYNSGGINIANSDRYQYHVLPIHYN